MKEVHRALCSECANVKCMDSEDEVSARLSRLPSVCECGRHRIKRCTSPTSQIQQIFLTDVDDCFTICQAKIARSSQISRRFVLKRDQLCRNVIDVLSIFSLFSSFSSFFFPIYTENGKMLPSAENLNEIAKNGKS